MRQCVLGLNTGNHDGAAAIVADGEILCMVEEERLTRRKRAIGQSPPTRALGACLDFAARAGCQPAAVGIGWGRPAGDGTDDEGVLAWLREQFRSRELPC